MIWVDREAKKLKERNLPQEWVDDMKTPSGRVHVGALRGVVIHDLMYKVLLENGVNASYSYVFNNMDPMDGMPSYLDKNVWEQYMGMPLFKIPSPEKGYESFAEFYGQEFINVFNSINCHPQIIWSSDLYLSGKMNNVIKEALDKSDKVREIYATVAKAPKKDDWYPFQVICENCGKVGTTTVYAWDGEKVSYRCEENKVKWAKGCGNDSKVSPYNGTGKLLWKVDWPAHWKVIGVTIEGAGKDHMSSGGSFDMASEFCTKVFETNPPYALPYEWFLIGGKKMSSSKGVGTTAKQAAEMLPPDVFRFLIVRTPIGTVLDFNPYGDTILNLFDDYDRCLNAHFDKLEGIIEKGKPGEVKLDFARIIELSEVRPLPEKRMLLPRFRTIVNLIKSKADILKTFEKQKGSPLSDEEKALLEERVVYAELYLKTYAIQPTSLAVEKQQLELTSLTELQKKFLSLLVANLETKTPSTKEEIQTIVFNTLKENGFQAREVFSTFYSVLTGQKAGPRAGDLILDIGLQKNYRKNKRSSG